MLVKAHEQVCMAVVHEHLLTVQVEYSSLAFVLHPQILGLAFITAIRQTSSLKGHVQHAKCNWRSRESATILSAGQQNC